MPYKSIVAAAAIALVAGLGSVSAAAQFTTLQGFQPATISAAELGAIRGALVTITAAGNIRGGLPNESSGTEAAIAAVGPQGLALAEINAGAILVCVGGAC